MVDALIQDGQTRMSPRSAPQVAVQRLPLSSARRWLKPRTSAGSAMCSPRRRFLLKSQLLRMS
jgi:hypothetical protein